jgi:UDP-N-acetylmuramoyl-L-alanyl-D-glutamate--2,6-diaminopimelate ligase
MSVNLKDITKLLDTKQICGESLKNINGITVDSRQVKENFIFVGIKGVREDGKQYVPEAISRGATVVVLEEKINIPPTVTLVVVPDSRKALAILSSGFYGDPSRKLGVIGVTGTNGKTTITYLVESIFKEGGLKIGVIGTIEYRLGDKIIPAPNTTPQSSELQHMLADMVSHKFDYAVMEVSSHALAQDRTLGCEFDVGIFTNVTRDHLDYHNTLENYLAAKTRLFSGLGEGALKKFPKYAVINIDDPHSQHIIDNTRVPIILYGIDNSFDDIKTTYLKAEDIKMHKNGYEFALNKDGKRLGNIKLNLIGKHNVYNALASIGAALSQNIDIETIKKGLEKVKRVPGRFELIDMGQKFTVVVDYAHTDDALMRTLLAAKELNPNRVIVVFGCGGDRDRTKRPIMGEIAVNNSDYAIVTSDNPRSEDPAKIALDVEIGIKRTNKQNYKIILDRHEAIAEALRYAREKDIVIIAGKGHETSQILKDKAVYFNDIEVVKDILRKNNDRHKYKLQPMPEKKRA